MSTLPAMTPDEMRRAVSLISAERFATFTRIAGTDADALALYHQAMVTAATLMPVTGLIEVALRNAICEQLRGTFGRPDWLDNPPPPFTWRDEERQSIGRALGQARRAAYARMSNSQKAGLDAIAYPAGVPNGLSHEQRSKARQRAIAVGRGDQVAQLTLFFWKRLFSPDYEGALWKRSLKRLFPDKSVSRADVAKHIEAIYVARNRLAHHEPVMGRRLADTLAGIDYVASHFGGDGQNGDPAFVKMLAPHRAALATEATALNAMLATFVTPPAVP